MAANGERVLKDGRSVVIRRGGPQDVPAVARLYLDLSAESFRSRFHGGCATPALAARLARVEPSPSGAVCLVAAPPDEPGRLAAEARYVPIDGRVAEFGLVVHDDYQGAGLGHLLLDALVDRAGAAGFSCLRAVVSLANAPMLRLLEPYGWVMAEPTDLAVACLEISAVGGMPGWPAARAGRRVLVERRGWFDTEQVAAMRRAGDDVRQCAGPRRKAGRPCPLVTSGRCRLAEEADLILAKLPADDEGCASVLRAHQRRWPDRLAR